MWQAMLSGVASLKAHQQKMNVIGNNIANINTTGFKSSRVHFQDLMAQTFRAASRPSNVLGGVNPMQVGLGVKVGAIDVHTLQGALEMTGRSTDLAIQGNGYFMLTNGRDVHYSRDGAFGLDSSGFLVHRGTGWKVLGWMADAGGRIDTNQPINASSVLQFPVGSQAAVRQTTVVEYTGNLNANALSCGDLRGDGAGVRRAGRRARCDHHLHQPPDAAAGRAASRRGQLVGVERRHRRRRPSATTPQAATPASTSTGRANWSAQPPSKSPSPPPTARRRSRWT
jgi:flagellar hook-basal body protein